MARRVLTGEKLEKELERLSLMREFERQYSSVESMRQAVDLLRVL